MRKVHGMPILRPRANMERSIRLYRPHGAWRTPKRNFGICDILSHNDIPKTYHDVLEKNSASVLWIWYGFDEVEDSGKNSEFQLFLRKIIDDKLDWAPHCIITSRHEREAVFANTVCLVPKKWTNSEVEGTQRIFSKTLKNCRTSHVRF
jgi:hypothetical protein